MQEFLRTITGDEKSNTNPTQILKVFITLKVREGDNHLDFEPTQDEFRERVSLMLESGYEVFRQTQRFPLVMLEIRNQMIEEIIERVERENQGKKNKKVVQRSDFVSIGEEFLKLESGNYE